MAGTPQVYYHYIKLSATAVEDCSRQYNLIRSTNVIVEHGKPPNRHKRSNRAETRIIGHFGTFLKSDDSSCARDCVGVVAGTWSHGNYG